ncbi:hypothetical protein HDU67_006791, partial [Dinochytrium kinnereticum]
QKILAVIKIPVSIYDEGIFYSEDFTLMVAKRMHIQLAIPFLLKLLGSKVTSK